MAGFLYSNPNAMPGVGAELVAAVRELLMREPTAENFFPIGAAIDGSNSRDPDNPTGRVDVIRDGMPMGKITATNKYAPSILGQLGVALTSTATTLRLLTAAQGTELSRRIGGTGTFKITGPATAGGTVRTLTATFSAVGSGSLQNEVQTIAWNSTPTAGTFTITLKKSDGTIVTTAALAYNATAATTVANAIIAVLGTAAVSCGGGPTADSGFTITFSGTGYTGVDQPDVVINTDSLTFTSTTGYTVTETTKGNPAAATVTVTALGVNEVQTVNLGATMTGGSIKIGVYDKNGSWQMVTVNFNATWTQTVADIQTALNAILGTSSVACAVTATHDMTITFSGTGYAALPQSPVLVDASLASSVTTSTVTRTTPGVDGRFVAGALIQPTDGSESIVTLFRTGTKTGVSVFNALLVAIDVQYPQILCGGFVRSSYILGYAGNDASTKAWIKAQLRTNGGKWLFDDDYLGVAV